MGGVTVLEGGTARPRTATGGRPPSLVQPSLSVADVVLLAHGSPDPRHSAGVDELARRVARLAPTRRVLTAYLDHHRPSPAEIGPRVQRGVVVPVLLTPAHHARVDVPVAVAALARGAAGTVTQAAALGPHPVLVQAAVELLDAAQVTPDRATGVVLFAAGTSDGRAVADLVATLGEHAPDDGGPWAVATLGGSREVGDVLPALRERCARVVAVPFTVADGVLRDRMADRCAEHGVSLVPGALCDTDALAQLVLLRAATVGTSDLPARR